MPSTILRTEDWPPQLKILLILEVGQVKIQVNMTCDKIAQETKHQSRKERKKICSAFACRKAVKQGIERKVTFKLGFN